jgi:MFS transporter, putative metabolite:H+ symporter
MKPAAGASGGGEAKSKTVSTIEDQINAIGIGRFHYSLIAMMSFLCAADGMEMLVLSLLSATLKQEWLVNTEEIGGLASAAFAGIFLGSIIGGIIGDQNGRRATVLFGGTIFVAGAVGSACAWSFIILCVFRSIVGFGLGVIIPAAMCSFCEMMPTQSRAFYQLFTIGIAWAVGEMIVCLSTIAVHRYFRDEGWWRVVLLVCSIPGLIGLIMAYFTLPESPHYLSTQGRHDEAEALIKRIAVDNGRVDALLQDGRVHHIAERPDPEWSWFQLFSDDLLLLTLSVSALWCISAFSYYGLTFVYPLVLEQRYHMDYEKEYWEILLAAAAEIPGVALAMYGVSREELGRRRCMALFLGAACVMAAVVGIRPRRAPRARLHPPSCGGDRLLRAAAARPAPKLSTGTLRA